MFGAVLPRPPRDEGTPATTQPHSASASGRLTCFRLLESQISSHIAFGVFSTIFALGARARALLTISSSRLPRAYTSISSAVPRSREIDAWRAVAALQRMERVRSHA